LDPNTTSQILRGLQAKGLIERSLTTKERSKHPTLTSTGVEVLARAMHVVENADAVFFAAIDVKKSKILKTLQILARSESLKRESL
jgi:DNA-binding MarR family transcriptional regulator